MKEETFAHSSHMTKKVPVLTAPVTELTGVGPQSAQDLAKLGIYTLYDLLWHLPSRYENFEVRPVEELEHQEQATITGTLESGANVQFYGRKKNRLTFRLRSGNHLIKVTLFNRAFMQKKLIQGTVVTVTGKWDRYRASLTAQRLELGEPDKTRTYMPVYAVSGSVRVAQIQKWIKLLLGQEVFPPEMLPLSFREKYKLPAIAKALTALHRPDSQEALKHARRRIVYEEFLLFQLRIQTYKKAVRTNEQAAPLSFNEETVHRFIKELPFSLTGAQRRTLKEIFTDMRGSFKMNRLLQGDVGSGKTVVAACAIYAAVCAGKQAALMVPTEILASQHYENLRETFAPYGISLALLTGSSKTSERREVLEGLKNHTISVVIGTHALIQADVPFADLGLVITDEQHRFGVEQRRALKDKGNPDVLFMTATPIPRTLAITAYGDMDVSRIDEQPAGRKPVKTYWVRPDMLPRVIQFTKQEINQGRQVYVICPLIEESEQLDVQNAVDLHARLEEMLTEERVALLHGRLHNEEKAAVMEGFTNGEIDVLVATTVIEVGVNVANATLMIIYDADRFGLAQLHQLRGRVGRGSLQSHCILLADPVSETGKERMRIMTETNDGFELAEKDLHLRGPGDILGRKQSGMPDFRLADPVHDYRALETARQDAAILLQSQAFWEDEGYKGMREYVIESGAASGEKLD